MAKKERAGLICRVSTSQQIESGLESQVACLKEKATKDGYEVPDDLIFQEQISGLDANKDIRQSLKDLMNAVENHKVDVVYTYELTRISRDPYNLVDRVKWFSDRKIPMYIYDAELWTLDRKTKEEIEETTNYVFGAATYGKVEAKKIKKRTMRARNELAKGGWYVGHLADGYIAIPYGNHKKIVRDDDRKKVIIRIFDLFINGKSTDEIAQILNNEDVPTTNKYRYQSPHLHFNYGKVYRIGGIEYNRDNVKWQGTQIAQIIANEWYIGVRSYNGERYEIPPIIEDEVWQKAVEKRTSRAAQFRTHRNKRKHNYILANYFFCGKCGLKMYGHTTGKDNHYYCSSVEYGKKCGLRGINKENVEAIVCRTILFRALNEVLKGEEGIMTDFFKITEQEKRKLKQEIATKNRDIESKRNRIEELNKRKANFYSMLADENKDAKIIEQLLNNDEKERTKIETELIKSQSSIIELNKRLKIGENTKKIADEIVKLKDVGTYRKLIENTIERIEIYNVDKSISYIKIHYINGKADGLLYSYPLLKNKYIYLHPIMLNKFHIMYDGKSPEILIEKGYYIAFGFGGGNTFMLLDDEALKQELSKGPEWGDLRITHYYSEKISVRDFVLQARNNGSPYLLEYDNSIFVEETDERRAEKAERYKKWRKKYNNGLPTTLPYVVHDGNYEEYKAQRKHLYNRKYKIKKNKRLSDEQKAEELRRIAEALSLLKAKVKYLSREEAVQKYKKGKE